MFNLAGEMVRKALRDKGMTQQELANKIGKDQTLISRFISGVPIADDTARLMSEELGLDADELLKLIQQDKYERKMKKLKTQFKPIAEDREKDIYQIANVNIIETYPHIALLLSYHQQIEKAEKYIIPSGVKVDLKTAFALKISEKTMVDDKIEEDDIIIVDPSAKRKDGDRVLITVNDEPELRRFYRKGNTIVLQSHDNSKPPIILLSQDEDIKVIGRVIFLHKVFR